MNEWKITFMEHNSDIGLLSAVSLTDPKVNINQRFGKYIQNERELFFIRAIAIKHHEMRQLMFMPVAN